MLPPYEVLCRTPSPYEDTVDRSTVTLYLFMSYYLPAVFLCPVIYVLTQAAAGSSFYEAGARARAESGSGNESSYDGGYEREVSQKESRGIATLAAKV